MENSKTAGLSIFYRILIAFLGVVVILGTVLTTTFYVSSKRSMLANAEETIAQQFETIQYEFDDELTKQLTRDLSLLAINPILDELMMSTERESILVTKKVEKLFQQFTKQMDSYQRISFIDYLGNEKVIFDQTGSSISHRNVHGGKLFEKIQAGTSGSLHFEGPFTHEAGDVGFSIGINKADPDIGEFGGAIIIDYNLEGYIRYLDNFTIFGENPVWMFSPQGNVLKQPISGGASLNPRKFFPKTFHNETNLLKPSGGILIWQDMYVVSDEPLARVAISIPSSILLRDVKSTLRFFVLAFIVSLIPILVISFYLSKYLTQPIIRLARAANRLAKGDLSTKVDVKTTGEVQLLVDNFNAMAEDLDKTTVSKEYVDNIIGSMGEALIVTAIDGEILRSNETATELTGLLEEEIKGRGIATLILEDSSDYGTIIDNIISTGSVSKVEKTLVTKSGDRIPIIFSASIMHDHTGSAEGIVCIVQDISDLRSALDHIQTLRGLLPICSSCKKIRHDDGLWEQVEAYLSTRTDAEFTHSYCPECAETMYEEINRHKKA